jgi:Protein of unknown function (DUF2281)
MLTAVNGIYENGHIILEEMPDFNKKMKVIVTFTEEIIAPKKKRQSGILSGKVWISDDFNAPLDDLKDYM